MSLLTKIFNFIKGLVTRPEFHKLLEQNMALAVELLTALLAVHDGAGLHSFRDEAFAKLKAALQSQGKQLTDTLITVLINLAYETIKARQPR